MSNGLENIKAGDSVALIESGWSKSVSAIKVTRVTKTLIVTGKATKWDRDSGRQRGSQSWNYSHIEPLTEKHKQTIENNAIICRRIKIVDAIAGMGNADLLSMSDKQEEELLNFLPDDWEEQ